MRILSPRYVQFMVGELNRWMDADEELSFPDALHHFADEAKAVEGDKKLAHRLGISTEKARYSCTGKGVKRAMRKKQ